MKELIKSLFNRIFRRIDYKKLYSSPWNKDKSDYLRKKIKGKKTIRWSEKRGKGSYFDKQLNHFVDHPMHGIDEEITAIEGHSFPDIFKVRKDHTQKP